MFILKYSNYIFKLICEIDSKIILGLNCLSFKSLQYKMTMFRNMNAESNTYKLFSPEVRGHGIPMSKRLYFYHPIFFTFLVQCNMWNRTSSPIFPPHFKTWNSLLHWIHSLFLFICIPMNWAFPFLTFKCWNKAFNFL